MGRHPGESRGPEIYESGFLFSQETLDSGFRRNDEFYGISTFYEFIKSDPSENRILYRLLKVKNKFWPISLPEMLKIKWLVEISSRNGRAKIGRLLTKGLKRLKKLK